MTNVTASEISCLQLGTENRFVYMNKPSVARYRNPNTGSCSQLVCAKPQRPQEACASTACTFYQCSWLIKLASGG